jgi:ribosomal protein L27
VNVKRGGDDTIYAMKTGVVRFSTKHRQSFDRSAKKVTVVAVE